MNYPFCSFLPAVCEWGCVSGTNVGHIESEPLRDALSSSALNGCAGVMALLAMLRQVDRLLGTF